MPSGDACPACGGPLSVWRSVSASEPGLKGQRFALRRCPDCGTAVTDGSQPTEDLHDTGAFRAGTPRLHALAGPLLERFDACRLELLGRLASPGARVLDAGAGQARFVAAARRAGWRRPGGLLLGLPNLASWQARLGGERWFHFDVPRHRTHFTVAGVTQLLRRAGFAVMAVQHLLLEHNPFGMWQTAVNLATERPSYLYNLLKRNAPLSARGVGITVAALGLTPVAALAELLAGLARRGGTMAVLARRV